MRPNFGYPNPQIILGMKCFKKYPVKDACGKTKSGAHPEKHAKPRPRTPVRMRMPRLRYRDSLRKDGLRAPLAPNYAESKVDDSCFRLNSFSTHSTKNT